jgi:glycosyltransferase involved in cell wall biosynthesis
MKQFRALAWRFAPDLCEAISLRLPALRAYRAHGRRRRPGTASGPITVAGFHGAVLGLGEAARGVVSALARVDVAAGAWDISERLGHPRKLDQGDTRAPPPGPGVIIAHMNPPELLRLVVSDTAAFEGKRVIGYWAWELRSIPALWRPAFRHVDEIWTPSTFTADAIRRAAPRRLTVRVAPHPIDEPEAVSSRARFALEDDTVIVLCAFDLRSTLARKNPFAALEAFRRAAERTRLGATLVFKTVGGAQAPQAAASLMAAMEATPNVILIDEVLSPADRDRLLASCDIFLSLHRSEGFGLLLAEAMAAGKAVVATGWSGNLDFMDEQSAVLVPYQLKPVDDPQGIYGRGLWAEPDIDAAAQALAALIDDPERRAALGARARARVRHQLSPSAVGQIMRRALEGGADPSSSRSDAPAEISHDA